MYVQVIKHKKSASIPIKECPICKTLFTKKQKASFDQWAKQKYCSNKCVNYGRELKPLSERLFEKVMPIPLTGCWIWVSHYDRNGCPKISAKFGRGPEQAARVSYELFRGAIPKGRTVLNTCGIAGCINPAHLTVRAKRKTSSPFPLKTA